VVGDEKGNEKGNEKVGDVLSADDSVGHVRTPESMNAVDVQDAPLLDEAEMSDDLEDALAESPSLGKAAQSAGNRPGYNAAGGYNALKSFNGQVYSGMAIGGSHTWNYDQGQWKETKVEPDLWKINFETTKRRARNAPKGSGAPVGTEYHWLVVAHQVSLRAGNILFLSRGKRDLLTANLLPLAIDSMSRRSTQTHTKHDWRGPSTNSRTRWLRRTPGQYQL
jgi:hypothetical protein